MFVDDLRRAVQAAPRVRLAELSAAVWKGYACGAVSEEDAQRLAEEIEALERRRRWTGSGWLPPQLAARFTMAEGAVLAVIAAEVARRGLCRLTLGHIASLAGVSRSTAKAAVREAAALGVLTSEEWRIAAWRNAPNTVRIVSPEWRAWLRMRDRRRAGADHTRLSEAHGAPGHRQAETGRRGVGSNPRPPLREYRFSL